MGANRLGATLPADVDIFEEIGRGTGEALGTAAAPVQSQQPQPGAPSPQPEQAGVDVEEVRGQVLDLISTGRVTDLVRAKGLIDDIVNRQTKDVFRQRGVRPPPPPAPAKVPAPPPSQAPAGQAEAPSLQAQPTPQPPRTTQLAPQGGQPGPLSAASPSVIQDLTNLVKEANKPQALQARNVPATGRPPLGGR